MILILKMNLLSMSYLNMFMQKKLRVVYHFNQDAELSLKNKEMVNLFQN